MESKDLINDKNYYYKQPFLSAKNKDEVWYLIDIYESISLLKLNQEAQLLVRLFNPKTKKIKQITFAQLDCNFLEVTSGLVDKVLELNNTWNF